MHFPTQLSVLDCSKFTRSSEKPHPFTDTIVCVGTKEGRVLLYHMEAIENCVCLAKTKAGIMFGEITGLSVQ